MTLPSPVLRNLGVNDMDTLVQQAQALEAAAQQANVSLAAIVAALQVGGGRSSGQASTPFNVPLPISPATLTDMLLAGNRSRGLGSIGTFKASLTIPAQVAGVPGTAQLTLPNPPNATILFVSPLQLIATFYSTGIILAAQADGQDLTAPVGSPNEFTLAGPYSIQAVQYVYVQNYVVVTGTNTTSTPTTVTFSLDNFTMDSGQFRDYWLALINLSADTTKAVAAGQ